METAEIKDITDRFYVVSHNKLQELADQIETLSIPKGEVFVRLGRPEIYECFVVEGICRSYLVNPEGDPITLSLYEPRSVVSPYITRTKQGLSTLNLEALTDVKLARFKAEYLEQLMVDNLDIRAWGNAVLRHELSLKVEKEMELASLTAKERLIRFRERYPSFENLIPHPVIASYLGITNVSLSRLRKEIR